MSFEGLFIISIWNRALFIDNFSFFSFNMFKDFFVDDRYGEIINQILLKLFKSNFKFIQLFFPNSLSKRALYSASDFQRGCRLEPLKKYSSVKSSEQTFFMMYSTSSSANKEIFPLLSKSSPFRVKDSRLKNLEPLSDKAKYLSMFRIACCNKKCSYNITGWF